MLGFLGDLLGLNAGNATKDAAVSNRKLIQDYDVRGNKLIDQGSTKAGGYLQDVTGLALQQIRQRIAGHEHSAEGRFTPPAAAILEGLDLPPP